MTFISNQIIDGAIDAIINARDFCGDEKQAVRDLCADENVQDWQKVWRIANFRGNAKWNAFKQQAGVNPKYIF